MSASRPGRVPASIERALARRYEQHKSAYLNVPLRLATLIVIPVLVAVVLPIVALYAPLPAAKVPLVAALIALPLYASAFLANRRFIRPSAELIGNWWRSGRASSDAATVWQAVEEAPRAAARWLATYGLAMCLAAGAVVGAVVGLGLPQILAAELVALLATLWTVVSWLFVCDLLMRPVRLDAASRLPAGFRTARGGRSFGQRLFASMVTVAVLAAFLGVVVTDQGSSSIDHAVGVGVLAIAVALVFSLGLTVVAIRTLLGPVDDLTAATRRVGAGDLSGRAAVTSNDELGALATSFNEMAGELQQSRERLVSAREEERRRLRRDLHDGLGPTLAGVAMRLEAAQALVDQDPAAATAMLGELRVDTVDVISEVRRLVHGLRPPQLDDLGLVGAIRERAARLASGGSNGGLRISIDAPEPFPEVPAALEVAVYRIVEEALTNVVRHSAAHACTVRLSVASGLSVEVQDDGTGIADGRGTGVGLSSMCERAAELGGSCELIAADAGGTVVSARLPLPERPA